MFLQEVILSPETLLQSRIIQQFEADQTGVEAEWKETITKAVKNVNLFRMMNQILCYETVGERVADMVTGDLRLA